jgi:hypothetical protein
MDAQLLGAVAVAVIVVVASVLFLLRGSNKR